ncbi:MAG: DUF6457 domain-containing protein [Cellulomonadaceae bacterium]|jgi:hypothetical protein|nr:DUF6457 domain-containing protein [Cellulomonadaceae bacterium]
MMADHLPPEALQPWLEAAAAQLGVDPAAVPIDTILDMTGVVARSVARPAAPLTAYLLGLAVGRTSSGADDAAALVEAVNTIEGLAAGWDSSPGDL